MSPDRFVLVHYDQIARDPRFDTIRDDDRRMGLWLRLLMLADPMWPLAAPLPAWVHRPTLKALVVAGLIEEVPNHYFRVHGLDRERERRAAKGKPGAHARWGDNASPNADANADANASANGPANADANALPIAMHAPLTPPPSPSPTPTPPPARGAIASPYIPDGDRDCLDTYCELTGFRPWGIWSGEKLKGAVTEYLDANVETALRAEYKADCNRDTLLDRTLARLARDADRKREASKRAPKPPKPAADPVKEAAYEAERRRLLPRLAVVNDA